LYESPRKGTAVPGGWDVQAVLCKLLPKGNTNEGISHYKQKLN
jgi:hypothetical protein